MGTDESHLTWAEVKIMLRNFCDLCCYSVTQVCIYVACSRFNFRVKDAGVDLMNSSYATKSTCGHLCPKYNFLRVLRCSHGSLVQLIQRV